ncbi:MAG: hypothetical protein HWE27_01830 [Gammaproteobacteria bacterium]|nr:hypothetical protein [Gammaproteobacteria bacterium]
MNKFLKIFSAVVSATFFLFITSCSNLPTVEHVDQVLKDAAGEVGGVVEKACEETKDAVDAKNKDC